MAVDRNAYMEDFMKQKIISGICGISMIAMACTGCGNTAGNSDGNQSVISTAVSQGIRENEISIWLEDGAITAGSHLVNIEENGVTITATGTYVVAGQLSDGYIRVDADKEDDVVLVLNGVGITCSNYAPIRIEQAGEVTIYLAENTQNQLTDGNNYALTDEDDNTDGVIFSKDDLKLDGDGILFINGNYKHGIVGKDDLVIQGGAYIIQAAEDGINVNDSIVVDGGSLTITAGDDGMHVDETLTINGGEITVLESCEGLEGHQVIINGGVLDITASDDGINSNCGSESDDEKEEWIPPVEQNEEGAEPPQGEPPEFPEGDNPGGNDPKGGMPEGEIPDGERPGNQMPDRAAPDGEMRENRVPEGDAPDDRMPQIGDENGFGREMPFGNRQGFDMDTDADSLLQINGGSLVINAGGDGLDSNGILEVNGGTIYVSGAANNGDGAIDYGITGTITGGTIIAVGFSGMAEGFGTSSTQLYFLYNTTDIQKAGTELVLEDNGGSRILSWTPMKEYNSVLISSPELVEGETYMLSIDGIKYTLK